jgi:hypothetical protein
MQDFDRLVAFETTLFRRLPPLGEVDGHDCGKEEFNIFVFTDRPVETFESAEVLRRKEVPDCNPIVAYRKVRGEVYTVLSPAGHQGFKIS